MPTATYIALANYTVPSNATSVTFASIPATYRDLVLVINGTYSGATEGYFYMYFNSDTGANYSRIVVYGDGSSASSTSFTNLIPVTLRNTQSTNISHIMDYSATDKHKTVLSRNNSNTDLYALAGRWANTAAITSIEIRAFGAYSLATNTTLSLYGIVS